MSFVSYAQNFEDVTLWRALRHIDKGFYLDIGAHDPIIDSVSKAFYDRGWRGVHVEPIPESAAKLREQRPDEIVLEVAISTMAGPLVIHHFPDTGLSTAINEYAEKHFSEGREFVDLEVKCRSLSSVFRQIDAEDIHWMKVDVEGMEHLVLNSWGNAVERPWVVLVESTIPNSPDEGDLAWEAELLSRGYSFVRFDGLNRIYVHDDHADLTAALAVGPNVFDNFVLSDTSSASYSSNIANVKKSLHAEFSRQIEELTSSINEKEKELSTSLNKQSEMMEKARSDEAQLKSQESGTANHITSLQSEVTDLRQQLDHLLEERQRLLDTVKSQAEAVTRSSDQVPIAIAERLAQQQSDLQSALDRQARSDKFTHELNETYKIEKAEMAERIAAMEASQVQVSSAYREQTSSYEARIEGLLVKEAAYEERISRLTVQLENQKSEVENLNQQLEKAIADSRELGKEVHYLRDLRDQSTATIDALKSELGEVRQSYADASKLLDQLEREKSSQTRKIEDLEAAARHRTEQMQEQRAEFQSERQKLMAEKREEAERAEALKAQVQALDKSVEQARGELERVRSQGEQSETENNRLRARLDWELASHKASLQAMEQSRQQLEESLAEQESRYAGEQERLKREKQEETRRADKLQSHVQSLDRAVEQSRAELERVAALAEEYDAEKSRLRDRLEWEISSHKVATQAMEETKQNLERSLAEQAGNSASERERLSAELRNVTDQLTQVSAGYEAKVTELNRSERQLAEFQYERLAERQRLEHEKRSAQGEVSRLLAEVIAMQAEVQNQLRARQEAIDEVTQGSTRELAEKAAEYEALRASSEERLARKDAEIELIRRELNGTIETIQSSTSWKVTAGLRWVKRKLSGHPAEQRSILPPPDEPQEAAPAIDDPSNMSFDQIANVVSRSAEKRKKT